MKVSPESNIFWLLFKKPELVNFKSCFPEKVKQLETVTSIVRLFYPLEIYVNLDYFFAFKEKILKLERFFYIYLAFCVSFYLSTETWSKKMCFIDLNLTFVSSVYLLCSKASQTTKQTLQINYCEYRSKFYLLFN